MGKMRVWATLALVVLVAVFAVACGGSQTTTTQATTAATTGSTAVGAATTAVTTPAELTTVNIGLIPYQGSGTMWLGDKKGFFKAHGLKLNLVPAQAPPAILASVQSGQEEFGFTTTVALITAIAGGLDVVGASPVDGTVSPDVAQTKIIVGPDSTVKTPAALAGKTVATPSIGSWIDLLIYIAVDRAGGDWSTVHTVQVPFSTMWSAIKADRVGAAGITEPFATQAVNDGGKVISTPEKDLMSGMNASLYVTTRKYESAHPEIVKAFVAAMQESIAYSKDHLDEMRAVIGEQMKLDAAATAALKPGVVFDENFNREGMTEIANLMLKYKFIKTAPTVDQILLPAN